MLHVIWGFAIAVMGILVAADYRGLSIKVYDLISRVTPGGPPDPRFTPNVVRFLWAILGVVGLCIGGIRLSEYLGH
ncbi:putative protein OS=Streptomyces microflavus OX=1919 GN=Smic_45690 PE=4 SV=1 [Streptomyces microflavus]